MCLFDVGAGRFSLVFAFGVELLALRLCRVACGIVCFHVGISFFVLGVEIFALAFGDGLLFFFSRCVFVFAHEFPRWVSAFGFSVGLLSFGFWRALGFWVWAF